MMTLAYEAARAAAASFIGGQDANEIVFTRGATEAINLVARALPERRRATASCCRSSSIIQNIVPWQLAGYEVDVCPLTARRPDRPRRRRADAHRRASRRRLRPCLERARLDPRRQARRRHRPCGRRQLLLDGCQAAPRLPVDVAAIGCDFYAFSGHKLYGPTGIGALWAPRRTARRDAALAGRRGDDRPRHVRADHLRAAAAAVRGGHAAYRRRGRPRTPRSTGSTSIGLDAIHAHEVALVGRVPRRAAPRSTA